VALPAFARRTPLLQQSIDVTCSPGPQQQTCSSGFAAVGPCWDGDGRTPHRFIDPAPLYYADSADNVTLKIEESLLD